MTSTKKKSHSSQGITQSECWSYMIVVFAFITISINCGIIYSSPIAMVGFEKQLNATLTVMQRSWLGASLLSAMGIGSILAFPLMRLVGCRGCMIIGGFAAAIGPAVAAFAARLYVICLTMSLLTGVGVGLCFIPSILMVEMHFPQKGNRLATSVALSGIGVGVAAIPPCLNLLMLHLDWIYVLLSVSGGLFLTGLIGVFMKPPLALSNTRLQIEIFKEDALSKPAFLGTCIIHFIWSFGSSIMYIYIPIYTMFSGHSSEQAAIMLSCVGGLSFFSRGIFRLVNLGEAVTMDTVTSVLFGLCLTTIFTGLFGDFSVKYTGLLSYSMLFGFYCGFWSNFVTQVNTETIGKDLATGGSGFVMLATSFGSLAGPPLAGFMYGQLNSFKFVFYLAGGSLLFCSLILLGIKLFSASSSKFRKEIVKQLNNNKQTRSKIRETSKKLTLRIINNTAGSTAESSVLTNV